jgi:hypothetical protein
MSATGAHARSERTQLYWQSRAWRLIRKTVPRGSSIGSTFYLIPVGLTATWIIAVFFGMSLLFLMPRSAQLASSSSPESTSSSAASAETSRSIQSTSSPEQLSAAPAPRLPLSGSPQQPGDGAAPQLGGPSGQNPALLGLSVMPAEPTAAHAVNAGRDQAASVEPAIAFAPIGDKASKPSPEHRAHMATGPRSPAQPHASSRRRPGQKPASSLTPPTLTPRTLTPPTHPPLQAIQDVLQKHSRVVR